MQALWTPSPDYVAQTRLAQFAHTAGFNAADYEALYDWSLRAPDAFWSQVWDFCGVLGHKGDIAFAPSDHIKDCQFFPNGRVNFAENMLRDADDSLAIISIDEHGTCNELTRKGLYDLTSQIAAALKARGIGKGDCIAGFVPNTPQSIAIMLAVQSLGAIWSSCSPDFGLDGVKDRFGQIKPKLLFAANGYFYNGKTIDSRPVLAQIAQELKTVQQVVIWPFALEQADISNIPKALSFSDFLAPHPPQPIDFTPMGIRDAGFILFSSGTTGKPKCIVHSAGGLMLQHMKEHQLHGNITAGDRLFYFTTCGWMMWNWLVSALASKACLVLYDGNPFYPTPERLFHLAQETGVTHFGTSAKAIDHAHKMGVVPRKVANLTALRAVFSTGSPLAAENFEYVYRDWAADVHLASISGGTDVCGCFIGGIPTRPVYAGEIQGPLLGMDARVFDENGQTVSEQAGELVCLNAHPSMPVAFYNDPDGSKYHGAYFDRFENVWCHGDWLTCRKTGGFVVAGRSDATLNPGGVRIGTAEIYRQIERIEEVLDSVVVAQDWQSDQRVVLFVQLIGGVVLNDTLRAKIKEQIRANTTPRHVPSLIIQVSDIPRTKSGKTVELAVRDIIHARPVRNQTALANPEALALFKGLDELSK